MPTRPQNVQTEMDQEEEMYAERQEQLERQAAIFAGATSHQVLHTPTKNRPKGPSGRKPPTRRK